MKIYKSNGSSGYNPMLCFTHIINGEKSYILFSRAHHTIARVVLSTVISISGFSLIAFSHPFEGVQAYGLLGSAVLLCLSMTLFVRGLMAKRMISAEPPTVAGRAPDIYAIEWFFNLAFATFVIIMSTSYFSNPYIKGLLFVCSLPSALMATIPFWGDALYTGKKSRLGH